MYSGNKNSFISILYMFDLSSKRNVEKIQKKWHILLFFAYFLYHRTPWNIFFYFSFQKTKILYVDNKSAMFHEV